MRHLMIIPLARLIVLLTATVTVALPTGARAGEIDLPITLDYDIVSQALASQLFVGPDNTAPVFADGTGCNSLVLSQPRVEGSDDGQLRILTLVTAKGGTPLNGRCMLPFEWSGTVETREQAYVAPGSSTIAFTVVDSEILTSDEQQRSAPGLVWNWIKSYIHPRLGAVTIDLNPAVKEIQSLIRQSLPGDAMAGNESQRQNVASSLALKAVKAAPAGLDIVFSLQAPTPPEGWPLLDEPVLSPAELASWDASWQSWDGFLTWLIKGFAIGAEPQLRDEMVDVLLDARYDLRAALAADNPAQDPVRELFLSTWTRLAPLLKESELLRDNPMELPGTRALQFATFISAANALQTLDSAAPHLGLRLDSNTLRSLARMLAPAVTDEELDYDTTVDPELRSLLGLDPDFREDETPPLPFVWVIPRVEASTVDPALVKTLTGWVPARSEIDQYLQSMEQLLEESIRAERERGKIAPQFFPVYENLVRATAWQESCWRQYISLNGRIQPIQSKGGAIGLMQINQHVWRGIYSLDGLRNNIGYNARAGNEILVHYLADYAIKRKEHEIGGDKHDLARAAYGVYNGGPRHLTRYRNPGASKYLKSVDAAFWKKYQAIRKKGPDAVRQCYGV